MFDTSENMPLLLKLSFELRCCWSFGPLPRRPCFSCDWTTYYFDWQLQSSYVSCHVPNVTETQLIRQRGWEEQRNTELNRKQNILRMATLPLLLLLLPSTTPSSQQPLIFILFHHLSISVIPLFFSSTKSVLIANHHKPVKWQIILHSFIPKPPSSYFVSQHVQRTQLPCLLIQSASRRKSRQIMPEDGGNSPPQPEMDLNNIPYFSYSK